MHSFDGSGVEKMRQVYLNHQVPSHFKQSTSLSLLLLLLKMHLIQQATQPRNTNTPFWSLDAMCGGHYFLRNAKWFNKRKDPRKVKRRAWKEKKNTHKSLHISSMSSLHLSHSTDAHILYKTTARRINLPEQTVWGLKPISMSFDPES